MVTKLSRGVYDSTVLAVAHREFKDMGLNSIRALDKSPYIFFDLKYVLPAGASVLRL